MECTEQQKDLIWTEGIWEGSSKEVTIQLGSEAEQEPEEELRGGCCTCKDRMGKSIVRGDEAGVAGAQRAKSRRLIRSPGPRYFSS